MGCRQRYRRAGWGVDRGTGGEESGGLRTVQDHRRRWILGPACTDRQGLRGDGGFKKLEGCMHWGQRCERRADQKPTRARQGSAKACGQGPWGLGSGRAAESGSEGQQGQAEGAGRWGSGWEGRHSPGLLGKSHRGRLRAGPGEDRSPRGVDPGHGEPRQASVGGTGTLQCGQETWLLTEADRGLGPPARPPGQDGSKVGAIFETGLGWRGWGEHLK